MKKFTVPTQELDAESWDSTCGECRNRELAGDAEPCRNCEATVTVNNFEPET